MLMMILRKMVKNKWLELGLLFGLIISVAIVSSMPIYTDASLQRALVKDIEKIQTEIGKYPAYHLLETEMYASNRHQPFDELLHRTDDMIQQSTEQFNLPVIEHVIERETSIYAYEPVDPDSVIVQRSRNGIIASRSGLEEHITITEGRMPSPEPVDGVYEVLVTPQALGYHSIALNTEFRFVNEDLKGEIIFKPVGTMVPKSYSDHYWSEEIPRENFYIPFETFERDFTVGGVMSTRRSQWYTVFDYSEMNVDRIHDYYAASGQIEAQLSRSFTGKTFDVPLLNRLDEYFSAEKRLRLLLWSLNAPILIMLGYYLFMVSYLIVDRQKQEIAVLRSRGSGRRQILFIYLLEGLILGAIALLVGPWLGLTLTKMLGASNGFLQFVQRTALPVEISQTAYLYALGVVIAAIIMMLIPVFLASKSSIVTHKQSSAREKASFFHKYGVDFVLLAVSFYGLWTFRKRLTDMQERGLSYEDVSIDPLLFLVPALFILGLGLLSLRIYPLVVRLIYWLGRKWWPPSLYATLIQVGRSSRQYQFLMVFLVMTLALGLFSASAARTINQNNDEKILYRYGADVVLETVWESNAPPVEYDENGIPIEPDFAPRVQYAEPPFQPYRELDGVEHAAKVFVMDEASLIGENRSRVSLIGIETDDFGQTAWFRNNLLDYHLNEYLNLIAPHPSAVLISQTMADAFGIEVGETINIAWEGVSSAPMIVYGIIEYFPTHNPFNARALEAQLATGAEREEAVRRAQRTAPMVVVGHLSYIQNNLAIEPYQVWLKLKEGASRQALYEDIEEKGLLITSFKDAENEIITVRNDPYNLAINGVMTLGFIISVFICFSGFLLYWILSLFSRVLQLGIFRAMGISFLRLLGMLIAEQVLTAGAAIGIGVWIGKITSQLFVPMFQLTFDMREQVPPFHVIQNRIDELVLYGIVLGMIIVALVVLASLLSRIKIHQAVKLGEDE